MSVLYLNFFVHCSSPSRVGLGFRPETKRLASAGMRFGDTSSNMSASVWSGHTCPTLPRLFRFGFARRRCLCLGLESLVRREYVISLSLWCVSAFSSSMYVQAINLFLNFSCAVVQLDAYASRLHLLLC